MDGGWPTRKRRALRAPQHLALVPPQSISTSELGQECDATLFIRDSPSASDRRGVCWCSWPTSSREFFTPLRRRSRPDVAPTNQSSFHRPVEARFFEKVREGERDEASARRESPWGFPEGDHRQPKVHRCNDPAEDVIQACFEGNPFKTGFEDPFKLFWQCMRSKPGEKPTEPFYHLDLESQKREESPGSGLEEWRRRSS